MLRRELILESEKKIKTQVTAKVGVPNFVCWKETESHVNYYHYTLFPILRK